MNGDREGINLPQTQVDFIKQLSVHGARIVLVVTGGSPIALGEVEEMVDAILFVWYPGMEGGRAVADVLFGDVSPAGKIPITFPKSLTQLPPFEDFSWYSQQHDVREEPWPSRLCSHVRLCTTPSAFVTTRHVRGWQRW